MTVILTDPNYQVIAFDTPMSIMSWGENIVVGFIPPEAGTVIEVICTTKGLPSLTQDSCNRRLIAQFMTALSNLAQATAVGAAHS